MMGRYSGEWANEPEGFYPASDEDDEPTMAEAVAEDVAANDDLIANGIYAAGDEGNPDDHPPTMDEDPGFYDTYYTPKLAASARALGSEMSGLTNDGMGVMTPDYSMVNQASVWGPTRLDPFPPGIAKKDILALLAYNWQDEEVDYYNVLASQDISAEELNKHHIFAAMNRINDWVNHRG